MRGSGDRSLPRPVSETGRRSVGNRKECCLRLDYASFPDSRPGAGLGPKPSAPCGIGAERALWAMKRGGKSGTARSTACGATMHVPRVGEARRSVWKRKGALTRLFRFPGRQPKYSRKNAVSEQSAKQPTIETGLIRKAIIWTQICQKQREAKKEVRGLYSPGFFLRFALIVRFMPEPASPPGRCA